MEHVKTQEGIIVSYERSGSGPPLVLLHGSLNNHQTGWMMVKPLLDPQFTVYAVNRRGRGETTATEGHSIADEANDVLAVLDTIGEPVYLLGHSFGAHVALAAAAKAPEKVRGLILYEPPRSSALPPEVLKHLQKLASDGKYDEMVAHFLLNGPKVPADQLAILRSTPFWPLLVADGESSVREWPALADLKFDPKEFSDLRIPVLLITGGDSPDVYYTYELEKSLPNARVVVIDGQEHIAQAMAPQVFVDTVTSFVKEAASAR
jgi:pimeloyl-ACP methyl ester carboxylesterase